MENSLAIQPAPQQSKLLELMAAEYKLDGKAFKEVLLKTVFPQDKPVSIEQLASFCAVAHEYKLNPLVREIFAFPAKSGGIIPIVSIDGWITMVQRHPQYNGHSFIHEWADGKVGGTLLSMTCLMRRKDREFPIENTEFMDECRRDTEPWKKWPSRMLRHKCFIQAARYAFGLSGIYDEDEAERILEGELKAGSDGRLRSEIQMPQRKEITDGKVIVGTVVPRSTITATQGSTSYTVSETVVVGDVLEEPAESDSPLADIFETNPEPAKDEAPAAAAKTKGIGPGQSKRMHAIANAKKTRSEADFEDLKKGFKIDSLSDFPADRIIDLEAWVNGKDF